MELGMNLTHYKNKVTDFPLKRYAAKWCEQVAGRSFVYDFYMIEWAGVDPGKWEYPLWYRIEVACKITTGKRVTTNDYGSADYYYVNKCLLKVYGGFNTSLSWKRLSLLNSIGGYTIVMLQ